MFQSALTVDAYLPNNTLWYNFTTGISYMGQGDYITLPAPLGEINVLVQAGSVIPMQEPSLTTYHR